jgi:hypothetical protein
MPQPRVAEAAADNCAAAASPAALTSPATAAAPARLVFYCGTGWRASLAFWYALELGLGECASVYDGGWWEWSADPGNPIVVRTPAAAGPADAPTTAHAAASGSPTCRDARISTAAAAGMDVASSCVLTPTSSSCRLRASSG